jgi:hypothetical protein
MTYIKKYWWIFLLIILAIVGILVAYSKGWLARIGIGVATAKTPGTDPTGECGSSGGNKQGTPGSLVAPVCSKPIYLTPSGVSEKCWSVEELGAPFAADFLPSEGTAIRRPSPYNAEKWYFNKQEGSKFCFVNNTNYPV